MKREKMSFEFKNETRRRCVVFRLEEREKNESNEF